ncbi:ATP-binding response regulator [Marinoscillum pacificum]|uniref:ATP-binding response regulator n=1 Tax=Marinoscillum pacificum TaxID=392723 RepID=UPI0021579131|nr:response regulator [Marinoscillum pacificum]
MIEKKNRILVVEDELNIRETIQDLLECSGYEVVTAEDGESGFFKVVKHQPDLIISDLMMPKMTGYELLEAVRSFGKSKFIPFIILSAKSHSQNIREGLKMGADDYLMKPFDHRELLESIQYRLSHQDELVQEIKKLETDRMKMDIHDNVQQTVVSLKMNIERILDGKIPEGGSLKKDLVNIKSGLDVAFLQIRNLIDGNAAHDLMVNGFQKTLDKMIKNFDQYTNISISYSYSFEEEPILAKSVEIIPVISEIMTNVVKHSKATEVNAVLTQVDNQYYVKINDDGIGFNVNQVISNGGLKNLYYRMEKINGEIEISSEAGRGSEYLLTFS